MLTQIRNATVKAREKELKQFNISAYESFILFVIRSMGDKATPAEISRMVFRQPHTISELLSRMEKKGLIARSRNPKNRRMTRSKLTRTGRQALRQASKREFDTSDIYTAFRWWSRAINPIFESHQGHRIERNRSKACSIFPVSRQSVTSDLFVFTIFSPLKARVINFKDKSSWHPLNFVNVKTGRWCPYLQWTGHYSGVCKSYWQDDTRGSAILGGIVIWSRWQWCWSVDYVNILLDDMLTSLTGAPN